MKFNCDYFKDRARERRQRRNNWHPWFAWYPVKVGRNDCRWFEWVDRIRDERWIGFCQTNEYWRYRLPLNE